MAGTTDIQDGCPFPEVAASLQPFIKTRQEVNQLRRGLHANLLISSVATNQTRSLEDVDPSTLSGVRKAYWKALEAHKAAQARYNALNAELDQVAQTGASSTLSSEEGAQFLTESYVPLMVQREKYRKLKIIQGTFARIHTAGGEAVTTSFDKMAKREMGDLPAPPSTTMLQDHESEFNAEYDLTQLKKAILSAQQQLSEHETVASHVDGSNFAQTNPHADLRGLQKAHNELTSWMERQLALITDVDGPKDVSGKGASHKDWNGTGSDAIDEIGRLYEQYLEARQRLLETAASPPTSDMDGSPPQVMRLASDTFDAEQRFTPSETVLPYLPSLMSVRQQEQNLLQQSAYTRRQLASAEAQNQAVLSRLAGESHLVHPDLSRGPPRGRDWTEAATSASAATAENATQRLESGQASAAAATMALQRIRDAPGSLDAFWE